MKPANAKDNAYIDFRKEVNDKDPKFKVGEKVRISKYKNILVKGYTPSWSEKFLLLVILKIQFHWHMLLMISTVKKLLKHFMKKSYKILYKKKFNRKSN